MALSLASPNGLRVEHDSINAVDADKGPGSAETNAPSQAVGWNGLDDLENPLNWSTAKKAYHAAIPLVYCFTVYVKHAPERVKLMRHCSTFAISVYAPSVPYVREQFRVSTTVAILPLSLYVLGTAFGPMIAAPLSETLGRRAVYFSCLPVFALFIIGAGFSKSFASLVICRFFAGVFGSPALSVGAGTNADLYTASNRGPATSFFVLAPFLGPVLG